MFKKLAVLALIVLSFAVISWSADAEEEVKAREDKEAQIHELRQEIEQLKFKIESEQNENKIEVLKKGLREQVTKLERLMAGSKPKGEFPEVEMAIERAEGQFKELRRAAEVAKEEGRIYDLKELQQKLDDKEEELKRYLDLLKQRRSQKKQRDDRELQIHRLQGAIKELGHALENNPDSEKAESWRASLKENRVKLDRLKIEGRKSERQRGPRGKLIAGWVISGTEKDVTIKTIETGKVTVLRVSLRRREDGKWVENPELANMTANLRKESLVLARYTLGDEEGAFFLKEIKVISLGSEEARVSERLGAIERRLSGIEDTLGRFGERRRTQRSQSRSTD